MIGGWIAVGQYMDACEIVQALLKMALKLRLPLQA